MPTLATTFPTGTCCASPWPATKAEKARGIADWVVYYQYVCRERVWRSRCRQVRLPKPVGLQEMKVWPFGVAGRAEASKPPHAALTEDRRGERCGKGVREVSGGDQEDE